MGENTFLLHILSLQVNTKPVDEYKKVMLCFRNNTKWNLVRLISYTVITFYQNTTTYFTLSATSHKEAKPGTKSDLGEE